MEKRYLAMWMQLCEGKLKVKIAHFWLPSASQKRDCLSSLLFLRDSTEEKHRTTTQITATIIDIRHSLL